MERLIPYLSHIGNCGAKGSTDPLDHRCICGLRQYWLVITTQNKKPIELRGM